MDMQDEFKEKGYKSAFFVLWNAYWKYLWGFFKRHKKFPPREYRKLAWTLSMEMKTQYKLRMKEYQSVINKARYAPNLRNKFDGSRGE